MAQVVKHLPSKYKALSSNPSISKGNKKKMHKIMLLKLKVGKPKEDL
jgi:hypothetical protein